VLGAETGRDGVVFGPEAFCDNGIGNDGNHERIERGSQDGIFLAEGEFVRIIYSTKTRATVSAYHVWLTQML
jgi:hypothetical protein